MQLQERLETLLTEIVQNQLVAGHFSVVPAVLKFQNSLPNFLMPHLANACVMIDALLHARSKVVEWQNFVVRTYEQKQ